HGHADEAPAVLRHEIDRFRRDLLGRERQVAFVLAIFVVAHDDDLAGTERFDRVLDAGERPGLLASPRNLQWRSHTFVPISSNARSTYLPTMSHSRLTRSPARARRRFVCNQVNGTICTSKVAFSSLAIVRLMPSTAIDPR